MFGYSYVLIDVMVYNQRGNILTPLNREGMYVIMNKKYKGNPPPHVQECKIRDRKGNKATCYMFIGITESPAISCVKG